MSQSAQPTGYFPQPAGFGGGRPFSLNLCPQTSGGTPFHICVKFLVDLTERMGERTMGRGLLRRDLDVKLT